MLPENAKMGYSVPPEQRVYISQGLVFNNINAVY